MKGKEEGCKAGMEGGRVSYTSRSLERNVWKGQDAGKLTVDVSLCFIPQEAFFPSVGIRTEADFSIRLCSAMVLFE